MCYHSGGCAARVAPCGAQRRVIDTYPSWRKPKRELSLRRPRACTCLHGRISDPTVDASISEHLGACAVLFAPLSHALSSDDGTSFATADSYGRVHPPFSLLPRKRSATTPSCTSTSCIGGLNHYHVMPPGPRSRTCEIEKVGFRFPLSQRLRDICFRIRRWFL